MYIYDMQAPVPSLHVGLAKCGDVGRRVNVNDAGPRRLIEHIFAFSNPLLPLHGIFTLASWEIHIRVEEIEIE